MLAGVGGGGAGAGDADSDDEVAFQTVPENWQDNPRFCNKVLVAKKKTRLVALHTLTS